jgi:hypothetical protein
VPRAPLPPCRCYRLWGETSSASSEGVTPPSSLLLAHASDHYPPSTFGFPPAVGLCRLLPAPAAQWPFPTLSLPIFPHVLGPLPRLPPRCIRSFLPSERWPFPIEHRVGASQIIPTAISVGGHLRGCSHSIMFGPVSLLASPIAPTHTSRCSASLGGRDFYNHAYHGWLPSPCSGYAS